MGGEVDQVYDSIFGHFGDVQRMIRNDRWKLIYYPHLDLTQLFDLQRDPWEQNDLSGDAGAQGTVTNLREQLEAWRLSMNDPILGDVVETKK